MIDSSIRSRGWVCAAVLAAIGALCCLAYGRALFLPLIADDYIQIELARRYGPVSGWQDLAGNALYRCRATSLVLTYWTERAAGLSPLAFHLSSLAVHILNSWLVFALGAWRLAGWRAAAMTAGFFAVAEGHQEAIVWYAALPEALVFTFVLSAFLFWLRWIQAEALTVWPYLGCALAFLAALASKESAVCLVGLQMLAVLLNDRRRRAHWFGILPFAILSCVYFAAIYAAKPHHLHWNDGTFALGAPFLWTLSNSTARIFWIWGIASIAILWMARALKVRLLLAAGVWMAVTLLPYSFLTYMPRVPSRHTYLASVALSLLAGCAIVAAAERWRARPPLAVALVCSMLFHNTAYLWTKKHRQYLERAEPTEQLIEFARGAGGPIAVRCFPYSRYVAEAAVEIGAGIERRHLRFETPPQCTDFSIVELATADTETSAIQRISETP